MDEAVAIVASVANGLQHAHDRGVIHRGMAAPPDGRRLALREFTEDGYDIWVRSSTAVPTRASPSVTVSTNGGGGPLWSHAGDELYYVDGEDQMIAAHLDLSSSPPRVLEREVLFEIPGGYDGTAPNNYITGLYDITADDQRFLMSRPYEAESDADQSRTRLIGVRNWLTEVTERVQRTGHRVANGESHGGSLRDP